MNSGLLILDDSTLEKPYSNFNALVYRRWSGKQKAVVSGINSITLLWTDGERVVPVDYRVFDKDRDGKTKNDHFQEMLLVAFERGFAPAIERALMPKIATGVEPYRTSYQSFCALGKSLLSRKNQLDQSETGIIRDAVRAYLAKPRYLLLPTA